MTNKKKTPGYAKKNIYKCTRTHTLTDKNVITLEDMEKLGKEFPLKTSLEDAQHALVFLMSNIQHAYDTPNRTPSKKNKKALFNRLSSAITLYTEAYKKMLKTSKDVKNLLNTLGGYGLDAAQSLQQAASASQKDNAEYDIAKTINYLETQHLPHEAFIQCGIYHFNQLSNFCKEAIKYLPDNQGNPGKWFEKIVIKEIAWFYYFYIKQTYTACIKCMHILKTDFSYTYDPYKDDETNSENDGNEKNSEDAGKDKCSGRFYEFLCLIVDMLSKKLNLSEKLDPLIKRSSPKFIYNTIKEFNKSQIKIASMPLFIVFVINIQFKNNQCSMNDRQLQCYLNMMLAYVVDYYQRFLIYHIR